MYPFSGRGSTLRPFPSGLSKVIASPPSVCVDRYTRYGPCAASPGRGVAVEISMGVSVGAGIAVGSGVKVAVGARLGSPAGCVAVGARVAACVASGVAMASRVAVACGRVVADGSGAGVTGVAVGVGFNVAVVVGAALLHAVSSRIRKRKVIFFIITIVQTNLLLVNPPVFDLRHRKNAGRPSPDGFTGG
jgi:hypothetical protein